MNDSARSYHHEQKMYDFLQRLRDKPGRLPCLRKPRGVRIHPMERSSYHGVRYPVTFTISSRGRTGAADRLALQNILRYQPRQIIHEGWLS
jgi:hypothetical protein